MWLVGLLFYWREVWKKLLPQSKLCQDYVGNLYFEQNHNNVISFKIITYAKHPQNLLLVSNFPKLVGGFKSKCLTSFRIIFSFKKLWAWWYSVSIQVSKTFNVVTIWNKVRSVVRVSCQFHFVPELSLKMLLISEFKRMK